MAKLSDQEQVTGHIQKLDPSIGEVIETLRQIILSAHPEISEQIKWNNPSFYYSGEMAPFNPKEYKRDIAVMNLHKNRIMVVFPSGAKLNDTSGLLTGDYADGRRVAVFKDLEDIKSKAETVKSLIKLWVDLVEK